MTDLTRGRVIWFELPEQGHKPGLVVSNNARNRNLRSALVVRITTSAKPDIPSIVPLGPADEPLVGKVLCDDIIEVYPEEVRRDGGAVSPATMRQVEDGLKHALGIIDR
jgi:mRNA interferase MazF